jgi:AcrR family transcriptional regulator
MARKRSVPSRPRTGNKRNPMLHQEIIAAATKVLAKEGPTRFTIEAVAKLAGCGKPTIYRWWPSRSALLLEVYDRLVEQELFPPEGIDLAKDLAAMVRQIWGVWRKGSVGSLYRLILSEMILEKDRFPAAPGLEISAIQCSTRRSLLRPPRYWPKRARHVLRLRL